MMVQRSVVVLLVSLTECKDGAGKISSRDEVEMVRIPMISGYTKVGDPIYQDFYMDVTWFVVLKLKLKYKVNIMIQRSVILLLMMVVFVGCGEDEPDKVKPKEVVDEGPAQEIIWEKDNAKMVLIPAGSFEMGDSKDEPEVLMKWSRPVHTVELDAFYMDVHEVTVGKFRKFVRETGYEYDLALSLAFSPTGRYPMIWVTWDDATAYAKWADKRLPTEAEWEYSARGGLIGKRYPWGDEITHDHANWGNTVSGKDKWNRCAPVGSFDPNGYGLYDMVGNVLEWCSDWYDPDYYSNSPLRNPQGPSTGEWRVLRGGSWLSASPHYPALTLRVASRLNFYPKCRDGYYGFRCVSGFN